MGPPQSSYVGIDPSLKKTGIGVIAPQETSAITLRGAHTGIQRLLFHRDALKLHLEYITLHHGPITHVCIEGAAHGAVNLADSQGQLRGVLAVCAADFCAAITVIPPTTLKLYATGSGAASKEKMIAAAYVLGHTQMSDDEADALWLAHLACALSANPPQHLKRYQMDVIHGIRNPRIKRRISTRQTNNV